MMPSILEKSGIKEEIAKMVLEGKTVEEIAKDLSVKYNEQISPLSVKYVVQKLNADIQQEKTSKKVNFIDDLMWLYSEQKERLINIRRLERQAALPMPEARENIMLLLTILLKLIDLSAKSSASSYQDKLSDMLKEVIGDEKR